jgi:hypothetical protein
VARKIAIQISLMIKNLMDKAGYKIPYDAEGNMMHYADRTYLGIHVANEWRENIRFWTSMKLLGMNRGRSAAYFTWQDDNGFEYPMFMTDLVDLLNRSKVFFGETGPQPWKAIKRGRNYGLVLDQDEKVV